MTNNTKTQRRGRPAKLTLRSSPRTFRPTDAIEKMLQKEMRLTGRTFTQIIDAALKAYYLIKH